MAMPPTAIEHSEEIQSISKPPSGGLRCPASR
jgi:hypothetical protein